LNGWRFYCDLSVLLRTDDACLALGSIKRRRSAAGKREAGYFDYDGKHQASIARRHLSAWQNNVGPGRSGTAEEGLSMDASG
jgi:hypothetical protein